MATSEAIPLAGIREEQLVRLTVDEYIKLVESGTLREGAPVELLDGVLVWKDRRDGEGSIMVVGKRHAQVVTLLFRLLDRAVDGHGCVAVSQQPLRLSSSSMPEPDVMLITGDESTVFDNYPTPSLVPLVIEVADYSRNQDRKEKLPKYARAGIPVYWIVCLADDLVEVHSQPDVAKESYLSKDLYRPGDVIPLTAPDGATLRIEVSRFLRPAGSTATL